MWCTIVGTTYSYIHTGIRMCCNWPGIRQSWDRVDINGLFITPRSNLWNAVKACAHVNNDSAVAVILILISVQINSVVELWAKKLVSLILLSALFVYLQINSFRNRMAPFGPIRKSKSLPWMDHTMLMLLYKLRFFCQLSDIQWNCSVGRMFGLSELAAYWSM